MNRFTLNGGSLNGSAALRVVLATAVLVASASVAAAGVHLRSASSTLVGAGTVRPAATRTVFGVAPLAGQATLGNRATKTHATLAAAVASATVRASVRREVLASTNLAGRAILAAFAASKLASGDALGVATLLGEAFLTRHGQATAPVTALAAASGGVTRFVHAELEGVASGYVETGQRYCAIWADWLSWDDAGTWDEFECYEAHSAYTLPTATATLSPTGTRHLVGLASLPARAGMTALAYVNRNIYHYGAADTTCTAVLRPVASTTQALSAALAAGGALQATALRKVVPTASVLTIAGLHGYPWQRHQGYGYPVCRALLAALGVRRTSPVATIPGQGVMTVLGVCRRMATGVPVGRATLAAVPDVVVRAGLVDMVARSELAAHAVRRVSPMTALTGTASLGGDATQFAGATAALTATAVVATTGTRVAWPTGLLSATATLIASSYLNIPDLDPSTEVLVRPAPATDFVRPEGTTQFVRTL